MRIVQAAVAVGPALFILWMGGSYLLDAGRLLLSPGVPVAFDFKSPGGTIHFRADGYRIDLARRMVSARGLSATGPSGAPIASVARIDARGLDPRNLRPVVKVQGVRAHLERDAKGFDLLRLLPKREGPPSTIPYSVTVLDAQVLYVDRTFKQLVKQVAQTDRAVLDGVGDDWRAEARVRLPGVGVADMRVQALPNVGTTVDLGSDALQLEGLAPLILPGLRVRSLVARGPVRLDIPKTGKAKVAWTMKVEAKDGRYQKYAFDSAVVDGQVSADGGSGTLLVRLGDVRARFQGSATLKGGGGQVVAMVPSPASLPAWVRAYLPPKTSFRGASYAGWVGWKGSAVQADGLALAERVTYDRDAVDAVRARVAYTPTAIDVRGATATWQGAPLAGDASYDPKTHALRAAVLAPRLQLAALARRLGNASGVEGTIGGEALVSGTLAKPEIEGRVGGRVALKGRDLGEVEARGAWLAGAARVDRLKVSGPLGAIVAGGRVRPDGTLDFKAEARGLKIERLMPDAHGLVSANLQVGGTLRQPKATGRLEAYRLAYAGQTLPAAGFDLSADRDRIDLTLFTAVRGTARVAGKVGASLKGPGVVLADPKTWLLDGEASLTGLQVGELPGADTVGDLAGILSVPRAVLSGRVGSPVLAASLAGEGLIVRGVRIDSLHGEARVDRKGATLTDLSVATAGGKVTGTGSYSLATKSGDVDLAVADLQLSRLLADVSQDVIVKGTLSAPRVHLAIRDDKPVGSAEGTLTAVEVNGVLAGDGNWTLDATGDRIKGDASVGRLDPTLRAIDASAVYNVKAGSLAATAAAKDVPLQALIAGIESQRETSEDEAKRLETVKGDLSGAVTVVRTREGELKVDASDLRAAAIRYLEHDYGTLTATSLVRRGSRWDLVGGLLDGPEGRFEGSGWVEEDGSLSVKATGQGVKVAAFSPFVPDLAQSTGVARFAVTATGLVSSPSVVGTAGVDSLFASQTKEPLSLALDELSVGDGKSSVHGVLRYGERFGGLLSLSTDWHYRMPIGDATFEAKADLGALAPLDPTDASKGLRVDSVALTDIPGLSAYIDSARTSGGTLTGAIGAKGTFSKPLLSGGIALRADRLGIVVPGSPGRPITRIDDTLKDLKADLGFDERNAPKLSASVGFSRGGTLEALATLGDLGNDTVIERISKVRDWKGLPVKGSLEFGEKTGVTVKQTVAGGTTSATITGRIDVSGQAVKPLVKGALVLSNLETSLPTLDAAGGDSGVVLLDPTFDLTVALAQAGRFRTATADLYLDGDIALKGTLTDPVATAELVTDRGQIRLPGGLVRVDKGGQISFAYRRPLSGGTPASATIDIQGRSQLTLARPGQAGSQRYDITLDMQGDLLRENGLRFDATSDPPELNKDEILNALGGTELITGVAGGGRSTETGVRNAFAGFALPGLLDPVTNRLAGLTGLEYFTIEYNAYDQTTLNFGRSLPYGFSFQGRQQVGTPTPGYRSIYDLRLSYNPRKFLPKLSKLSFTVGTDQDRPWKASVEYGTRFGARGAGARDKHVLFPEKR